MDSTACLPAIPLLRYNVPGDPLMAKRTNRVAWGLAALLILLLSLSIVLSYGKRIGDWQWEARALPSGDWYVGMREYRNQRPPADFTDSWTFGCVFFHVGVVHWVPLATPLSAGPKASIRSGTGR
jgi:hypothetical protein